MNKSDQLFEALEKAFRRGANWVVINGGSDGLNKAAYDFADYETSPLTAADRSALSAALSLAPQVKVKPLEWVEHWGGADDDLPSWRGRNPLGLHVSVDFIGKYNLERHSDAPQDELEAAKSAAQADYTARIMSVLDAPQVKETPPPSTREVGE